MVFDLAFKYANICICRINCYAKPYFFLIQEKIEANATKFKLKRSIISEA